MMEKVLSFEKDGILYGLDFKDVDTIIEYDQTKVTGGRLVRVLAWYDNEWGFSCRMADVAGAIGRLI